jgi:DNA-binding beta-propeller fold protein YncE
MYVPRPTGRLVAGLLAIAFALPASAAAYHHKKNWGGSLQDSSHLGQPYGVAVGPYSDVFVADRFHCRIRKYERDGRHMKTWGSCGSGHGQFADPHAIAVDQKEHVYVADTDNNRIQVFDRDGNFLRAFGGRGRGTGHFQDDAFGIAVRSDGDVLVTVWTQGRIDRFGADGQFKSIFAHVYQPSSVAADPKSGDVFVGTGAGNEIIRFDHSGKLLKRWGSRGTGHGQFNWVFGIAVDQYGSVWATDWGNGRIQRFDENGHFINTWSSSGHGGNQLYQPWGIGVSQLDTRVYVADAGNNRISYWWDF